MEDHWEKTSMYWNSSIVTGDLIAPVDQNILLMGKVMPLRFVLIFTFYSRE